MGKNKNKNKLKTLCEVIVALVAICAFVASIYQMYWYRKDIQTTHRPYLEFHYFYDDEQGLVGINIENNGLGPAIIRALEVEGVVFGPKKEKECHDLVKNNLSSSVIDKEKICFQGMDPGFALFNGKSYMLIHIDLKNINENVRDPHKILAIMDTLSLEITYSDIFEKHMPTLKWKEE